MLFVRKVSFKPQVAKEHAEQKALFIWAGLQAKARPELGLMFAIPNGGHRHPAVAGQLKAEGVKPGVPDIFLAVARNGFHGLFVEMKRTKGGTLTDDQKVVIPQLKAQGFAVEVCKGWLEAKKVIEGYLDSKPEPIDWPAGHEVVG